MDDPRVQAAQWCDDARRSAGARDGSSLERLSRWLNDIDQGLRLRRQLDAPSADPSSEQTRHEVVRALAELQKLADAELAELVPGTPTHQLVAARAKEGLNDVRAAISTVLSGARAGPLPQAMALEGLRGDLEWLSTLIARLDGESAHRMTAWVDVELGRLRGRLARDSSQDLDPRNTLLTHDCERMQSVLLKRRVERELGRAFVGWTAEELWTERFHLSRLQAQVEALDRAALAIDQSGPGDRDPMPETPPQVLDRDPRGWLAAIERRREELADVSVDRLGVLARPSRVVPSEHIVAIAVDEVNETIAFLEDMPLPRAVKRLALLHDDLQALVQSCRAWSSAVAPHREPQPRVPNDNADVDDSINEAESQAEAEADAQEASKAEMDARERQAATDLRRQLRRAGRLSRRVRAAWQEKLLALRMQSLFGRRFVGALENTVLVLILVLFLLIAAQVVLERMRPNGLSVAEHEFFAWADLAVCSVFLFEFFLKLALAPAKLRYFARHFLIDLVASLPFGFFFHSMALRQVESAATATSSGAVSNALRPFIRVLRVGLRFVRVAVPFVRLALVPLIVLRFSDRLVRRMAGLLNRNIILFEPLQAQKAESSDRHRLLTLRSELEHTKSAIEARLDREQRRTLSERMLRDLAGRIDGLPAPDCDEPAEISEGREIPVEQVVERLIQMTPERLIDRTGPAFVRSVDRYLRLLDLPVIRRLPVIRNLVAYREKSPAEAVALAANYLGHLIQRVLNVIYFFADLHGTLSPPVFLDRLGATLINATRTPAKRLLWLGSVFLFFFIVVNTLSFLSPFRGIVDRLQNLMGWPVIILGGVCVVVWYLGTWFRKIANQSADFCERVVEAQFATHTKNLKSRRRDQDAQFLAERVIDPELLLRAADDRPALPRERHADEEDRHRPDLFENRELAFLRSVRLLYQDYLDGSPLHRSDTKASVQLLGNLALSNLRRSHLGHLLREGRSIDRLDLNRAGGLFGGAYLWFNYITRLLVQETALLILDYNRHAVPIDRLACAPDSVRREFQLWLAGRLKVDPEQVWLPELATAHPEDSTEASCDQSSRRTKSDRMFRLSRSPRPEASAFLETVEFTAVDFLADEPDRDSEIETRFGPQVAELVRRDRQQNVRRAFRSFPLHELPLASRTINPYALYEAHLAGGRVVLLPFVLARAIGKGVLIAFRGIHRVVREILHPHVDRQQLVPSDTYWAALRKIHRMRKPVFMGSLWLRARFDVEYLGLPLPTAPPGIASQSLMESDLDYIGATRQDRIIAEQVRRQHQKRLEWIVRWLDRFGWTFDSLPGYLVTEIPFLANRGGEALRAIVTACILDHNDIATLALAIGGLKRVFAHAANAHEDPKIVPGDLPDPIVNLRRLWHPVHQCNRPMNDLFDLPCFPAYSALERRRILRYLSRHRRIVRGWSKVVLGQGGPDPWATVKARMRDVILRTDLWSDQILVLRAVQSLTMLDLQHNCELVWKLGGYTRPQAGDSEPDAQPPRTPTVHEPEPMTAAG